MKMGNDQDRHNSFVLSKRASRIRRLGSLAGEAILLLITSTSALAVLFIFYFIAKEGLPFIKLCGLREFLTSTQWYPTASPPVFGALAIFVGSGLVTLGAILVAVPLGLAAAVCLSDVLPFSLRQFVKPVIEILAAIPSVAYGFFALVIFAPMLQNHGGRIIAGVFWVIGIPTGILLVIVVGEMIASRFPESRQVFVRTISWSALGVASAVVLHLVGRRLLSLKVSSGTNALNVSIILGIMALPTIVSVAEDALQSVGRELREGCYALGATRAETMVRVIIPAAGSGICAAVILGVMRAIGETMVVWMASGNAAQIPTPWYSFLQPIRTLTATIAGEMGEADHITGSARYHVLFLMALCLVGISFLCDLASEWILRRGRIRGS